MYIQLRQAYSCVADSNAGGAALAPVGSAISCSARRLVDFNPSDATARRLVGAGCGEPAVAAFGLTNAYEHSAMARLGPHVERDDFGVLCWGERA